MPLSELEQEEEVGILGEETDSGKAVVDLLSDLVVGTLTDGVEDDFAFVSSSLTVLDSYLFLGDASLAVSTLLVGVGLYLLSVSVWEEEFEVGLKKSFFVLLGGGICICPLVGSFLYFPICCIFL